MPTAKTTRTILNQFIKDIYDVIDPISTTSNDPWVIDWKRLTMAGLVPDKNLTRYQITNLILGKPKNKLKLGREITDVINGLRKLIPEIDKHFKIRFSKSDSDVFKYEPTSKTEVKSHDTNDNDNNSDDEWTNVPGIFNPKEQTIDQTKSNQESISSKSSSRKNSYAELEQENEENMEPQVHDSSFESSQLISYDSYATKEDFSGIKNKYYAKVRNIYDPVLYPRLNENNTNQIHEAIKSGNVEEINEQLLAEWILSEAHDAVETAKNSITDMNGALNENLKSMTNHNKRLQTELTDDITNIRKQTQQAKTDCEGIVIKYKKEMEDIKNNITNTEMDALSSINSATSHSKTELMELNKQSEEIIQKLHASKEIGMAASNNVNNLITKMNEEYASYEEQLMDTADHQKETFRNWMERLIEHKYPNITSYDKFQQEREEMKNERELMKAERILLKQSREELKQLINETRSYSNNQQKNEVQINPRVKIEDDDQSIIMQSSIEHSNQNAPLKPDTVIRFDNGMYRVVAYVMKPTEPISFKQGHWHYDLHTAKGVELFNCSDKYMSPYEEEIHSYTRTSINNAQEIQNLSKPPSYQNSSEKRYNGTHDNDHISRNSPWKKSRLAKHEFEYPIGNEPQSVSTDT
jgi:hypothetical protein